MLNDGTGKFLAPQRTPITVGPNVPYPEFLAGNFRTFTKADVIYLTKFFGTSNVLAFFPGNGDGTFGSPTTLAIMPNALKVVSGDFNGDHILDIAVLGNDANGQNLQLDVFLGHGDGSFTHLAPETIALPGKPQQFFAVELNHDGNLDLLINDANPNSGSVASDLFELLGNGDGTFQAPATLIANFGVVALADVNGDGHIDLIQDRDPTSDLTHGMYSVPAVTIYLGLPDGSFEQTPSYDFPGIAAPIPTGILVGDFNADGKVDIAYPYFNDITHGTIERSLRILEGNGDGTFTITDHTYQLQGMSQPFTGMDFNGDGATDLVELTGYTSSFHTIPAMPAPALDIALDSSPVIGSHGSAMVSLDKPAAVAQDVSLSASDSAIQLPASLHFTPGEQVQHFAFTLGTGFDKSRVFALYATLGREMATAYGDKPNPNAGAGVATSLSDPIYPISGQISTVPGGTLLLVRSDCRVWPVTQEPSRRYSAATCLPRFLVTSMLPL